jgi:hypothetical protein
MHETPTNRRRQESPVAPPLARPARTASHSRLLVGVIVLLLLVLVGILLSRQFRKPKRGGAVGTVEPVGTAVAAKPAARSRNTAPAAPAAATRRAPATAPVVEPAAAVAPAAPAAAVPDARVVQRLRRTDGARGKLVPGIRRGTNSPNPLVTLRTTSERVMSQLLRTRPGDPVIEIGLGRDFARDFAASLTNLIEIYETDTPADVAHKESIGLMKEEMRKMVEEGESPEAILIEYRKQLNELAAYRLSLQRQLNELKKAGDLEEAAAFVEEANTILVEYGMRPLILSPVLPVQR